MAIMCHVMLSLTLSSGKSLQVTLLLRFLFLSGQVRLLRVMWQWWITSLRPLSCRVLQWGQPNNMTADQSRWVNQLKLQQVSWDYEDWKVVPVPFQQISSPTFLTVCDAWVAGWEQPPLVGLLGRCLQPWLVVSTCWVYSLIREAHIDGWYWLSHVSSTISGGVCVLPPKE